MSMKRIVIREWTRRALLAVLLLCGVLSPAIYIGADVLAVRLYPGFSYADQGVSELFAIGAPTSGLVVRLFTISSTLLLAFAFAVWWSSNRSRLRRLTAVMLACSTINGLVLWNFFPMHMRGADRTMTDTMHLVFAANPFVLLSLIFGAAAFRNGFRVYTIATITVLLALAVYGFSHAPAAAANEPTPWMGLTERIAQYADGLWQIVLAVVLWRERRFGSPNVAT
jgi:uncharacterized protein DUF998